MNYRMKQTFRKKLGDFKDKFKDYELSKKVLILKAIRMISEKNDIFTNGDLHDITGFPLEICSTVTSRLMYNEGNLKIIGQGKGRTQIYATKSRRE